MIGWVIGVLFGAAAATAATAVVVVALSDDIREAVATWLRNTNRNDSDLMRAVVILDQVGAKFRAYLRVRPTDTTMEQISDRDYALDEIDDPDMRRQVMAAGWAQKNALELLRN